MKSVLAASKKANGGVALHQIKKQSGGFPTIALESAVAVDEQAGIVHRRLGEGLNLLGRGKSELSLSRLPSAQYLAGAAEEKILLRYAETVIGLPHQRKPSARRLAECRAAEQKADAMLVAAPYPASQLVELGKAKAVRMFNDHQGRVGNVDPHLDDGGGDQDLEIASLKGGHHEILVRPFHPAVNDSDLVAET